MSNKINISQDKESEEWFWSVNVGDGGCIASGNGPGLAGGFLTRQGCLEGLFAVLFGIYDESSVSALYSEWQESLPKQLRDSAVKKTPTG